MLDTGLNELMKNGVNGIFIAVLLVYIWYSETVKFPKMLAAFKLEVATEREVCAKNHEEVMKEIRTEGNDSRKLHQQTRHGLANIVTAAQLKKHMDKHRKDFPDGGEDSPLPETL